MRLFAFLILSLSFCGSVRAGELAGQFKLISYNIRYVNAPGDEGELAWTARREPSVAMVRRERPDVIGYQEPRSVQVDFLIERLPEYGHVLAGNSADGYLLIQYLKAKYDLVDSGHFWLSETPDILSMGWDGRCRRITVWVRLREKRSRRELFYFNTHLDHKGTEARLKGAALNVEKMEEIAGSKAPVFISGDMNAEKGTPTGRFLVPFEAWMESARAQAPQSDDKATYNGFGKAPLHWLDYIYYRNARPLKYETLDGGDYGVKYISDHYPIACTFRLR